MRIIEWPPRNTTVLELHGTLTGPDATELLNTTVCRLTRGGPRRLVLNLEHVPAIDAAGLGALAAAYGVVRETGGAIRLAHVAKRVQQLLVVCRLNTVLETFDAVEDAVATGSGASPDPNLASSPPPYMVADIAGGDAVPAVFGNALGT